MLCLKGMVIIKRYLNGTVKDNKKVFKGGK